MTEPEIKRRLWCAFSNFDYRLFNVYVFSNESDFLAVSKSGYVWEVEIKISRSDFFNDFKKKDIEGINKHEKLKTNRGMNPNKFCFAVPEGMIEKDEIPDYAGLIEVYESVITKIVKQPKFIHKDKLFENNYFLKQMLSKFYHRHMDLRNALDLREWDIKYKQERLKFSF